MDIRDGKCSWLVVQALNGLADANQRALLLNNYGQHDDACEAVVKTLYNQLNIHQVYERFEQQTLEEIVSDINVCSKVTKIPLEIFYEPLYHVYKRQK